MSAGATAIRPCCAMLGSQPCSGKSGVRHGQTVEKQVEGSRLELAGRHRTHQVEEIEAPVAAGRFGMPPTEHQATCRKEHPAKCLILNQSGPAHESRAREDAQRRSR